MMTTIPTPSFLSGYWQDAFQLKQHLQEFLDLDAQIIEQRLATGMQEMAELGHKDFDWEQATAFYREKVKEIYLFELGSWHLVSHDYIGNTLRLVTHYAQGRVLDFGGGIGTHAIAAALSPDVKEVVFCDINPVNVDFVKHRVQQLGLSHKIIFCQEIPVQTTFDTIVCFDVLEHLPDPSQQLLKFHQALQVNGKAILNWNFFKGFNQEQPFHLDDPEIIATFFRTLQSNFLEIFHPYLITARCYEKLDKPLK